MLPGLSFSFTLCRVDPSPGWLQFQTHTPLTVKRGLSQFHVLLRRSPEAHNQEWGRVDTQSAPTGIGVNGRQIATSLEITASFYSAVPY